MKNILAGFFMATTMFLIIGATQEISVTTSDNGKYQGFAVEGKIYIIDTRVGQVYYKMNYLFDKNPLGKWHKDEENLLLKD